MGLRHRLLDPVKNNEVAPVIAMTIVAIVLVVATRGRLGYPGTGRSVAPQPAMSTP